MVLMHNLGVILKLCILELQDLHGGVDGIELQSDNSDNGDDAEPNAVIKEEIKRKVSIPDSEYYGTLYSHPKDSRENVKL